MTTSTHERDVTLEPHDTRRLASLCGQFNGHIRQIEKRLNVEIHQRGNVFRLRGHKADTAKQLLSELYAETQNDNEITPDDVHLAIQESSMSGAPSATSQSNTNSLDNINIQKSDSDNDQIEDAAASASIIKTKKSTVKPRGGNQQFYVQSVRTHDINFGIGPAGTGKTYLAVACAVEALTKDEIERILLVRPAVEAGEKLGFLPGDLAQKVDPYLRPLYDALYEMLGFETVGKLIEKSIIEIAPLAYMRGRTLNNSFVILDESQNTTREQMKMFLTRIGFGSTAVITGDPSQVDLPRGQASGLKHALEVLDGVDGVSFTRFITKDVVRHPIVQRIVEAYERAEAKVEKAQQNKRENEA